MSKYVLNKCRPYWKILKLFLIFRVCTNPATSLQIFIISENAFLYFNGNARIHFLRNMTIITKQWRHTARNVQGRANRAISSLRYPSRYAP